jgi:uncharacterized membrane protein
MADPAAPTPPPPPPAAAPAPEVNASTTGLPSNVAAALACIPLVGGIVFFILEKRDEFVRFYAMQSIIFGGAWFFFNIVSAVVHLICLSLPGLGGFFSVLWGLVAFVIHLAFLIVWIIVTIKAFTNVRWEIPYLGPMARKQFDGASGV